MKKFANKLKITPQKQNFSWNINLNLPQTEKNAPKYIAFTPKYPELVRWLVTPLKFSGGQKKNLRYALTIFPSPPLAEWLVARLSIVPTSLDYISVWYWPCGLESVFAISKGIPNSRPIIINLVGVLWKLECIFATNTKIS